MKKKTLRFNVGALLMFLIFGVLFLLLIGRIAYIQATGVVNGHELAVEAANKYQRQSTLTADRGKILDRNGNIIAEDTLSYKVIAVVRASATTNPKYPRHVIDPQHTAKALAEVIPLEEQRIYEILTRDGDPYQVEFGNAGRGLSYEQKEKIEQLKLPGIILTSEKKRFYPNGSFAAHLIGFAQKDEEDEEGKTVGMMGIEKTYNKQLTGKDGQIDYKADLKGYLLPNSEKMVQPAQDGSDIYLTVDKTIQNFLDEAMTRVYDQYSPKSMMGIVANPKTGEILAMSQRPTFDPMTREGLTASWLNEAVENVIEPGSTMKVFTVSAAMDTDNWHPNIEYKSGKFAKYGVVINDHNLGRGWGPISYLEGFQRSSNTAMAHQLEIMGYDTLLKYLDRFGFGQKTGIDLPKETQGKILSDSPVEVLTTSFGQGSTVTPIQLIQAFSAVANDGKMMQPYIINKIVNPNTGKTELQSEPVVKGNPISKETADQMKQLLASTVTSEHGTAQRFALDGYTVGGKTGTAQIPKNGKHTLGNANEYLYSFIGMAPVEDPQFIVYVYVSEPKLNGEAGSEPVSQVFNSVMQNSLMYYNIEPSTLAESSLAEVQNFVGRSTESIKVELANYGIKTVVIGEEGNVTSQFPAEGTKLMKGNVIFLKTEGAISLPDFTGWSLRNVLVYKQLSKLPIEIIGEGYAVSQSISKGAIPNENDPIVVQLRTPEQIYNTPPIEEEVQTEEETVE
jgi:penicillin-binding protein 2B